MFAIWFGTTGGVAAGALGSPSTATAPHRVAGQVHSLLSDEDRGD